MMKKYRILYDTADSINNIFEIEAEYSQDALEAFFQEIQTETETENIRIIEL